MLHYETVSSDLIDVLKQLMKMDQLKQFRLVGGTSLALQLGHRKSIDIDLFTDTFFEKRDIEAVLAANFKKVTINWQNVNGFTCMLNESIKVDLFNWHTRFLLPTIDSDGLRLMNIEEIGAMKLETITDRKEKKDFFDIAFLLKQFSLNHLLNLFHSRIPYISRAMVLESLTAIDKADDKLEPQMIIPMDWKEAKKIVIDSVESFYNERVDGIKKAQEERLRKAEELLRNKREKD